jgi:cellulose synthase/poly-beta-1,6-N-acetylglucosamine synthase-like glycosyltransferase
MSVRDSTAGTAALFSRGGRVSRATAARRAASVTVVIPTLNEAANLPHVLAHIPEMVDEVVLVDGHSKDGTIDVARTIRPDVRVVLQDGRGKGNALACGFAAASGDIIVMLDADASNDPREIPQFVAALLAGNDFAKGSRFAAGGASTDITPIRAFGNRCSVSPSTCCFAPATPISATATTRSGATACRTCTSPATASRSRR